VSELHLKFLIDIVLVCGPKMLPKWVARFW
jgi:hypothetical protein